MIKRVVPLLVFVAALAGAWAGGATIGKRYRVSVTGLPSTYVDDLARTLALQDPLPDLDLAPETLPVAAPPAGPGSSLNPGPVDAEAGRAAPSGTPGAGTPSTEVLVATVDETTANPPTPTPTASTPPGTPPPDWFVTRLASIYFITDPAVVEAIWGLYQAEPASLDQNAKVGNAVIRNAYATGSIPAPGTVAPANPTGTRGTVLDPQGVQVRDSPWGASRNVLPQGATFDVVPPPDGNWYRLSTGGWVPALWVDVQ